MHRRYAPRVYFSANTGNEGGGGQGESTTTTTQTQAGGGNTGGGDKPKTFTQEELDAIVTDRLGRERKKYEGFDDIKKKAARLDELERAQQSEVEKREQRIKELEGVVTQAQARERSYNLRDAITDTVAATDFGHTLQASPSRVVRLLDPDAIEWDGDKPTNVKALLTGLVRSDAYLFAPKAKRTGSGDGGAGREVQAGTSMNDRIRQAAGRS